jgi:hypothetical protein
MKGYKVVSTIEQDGEPRLVSALCWHRDYQFARTDYIPFAWAEPPGFLKTIGNPLFAFATISGAVQFLDDTQPDSLRNPQVWECEIEPHPEPEGWFLSDMKLVGKALPFLREHPEIFEAENPSNFIARCYKAGIIGLRISKSYDNSLYPKDTMLASRIRITERAR